MLPKQILQHWIWWIFINLYNYVIIQKCNIDINFGNINFFVLIYNCIFFLPKCTLTQDIITYKSI